MLPEAKILSGFKSLFKSRDFWSQLWQRDVSTIVTVEGNIQKKYMSVFKKINTMDRGQQICHLAYEGYDEILYPLLENLKDYNWALANGASGGHMKIVEKAVELGANCHSTAMELAASSGNMRTVLLMVMNGARSYDGTMIAAAGGGHKDIVELMLRGGATHCEQAMVAAAKSGHIEIVQLFLALPQQYTKHTYDWIMNKAALGGHKNIVELMLAKGANNYNGGLLSAVKSENDEIVKLMLEKGANNYESAISSTKNPRIIKLISSYRK